MAARTSLRLLVVDDEPMIVKRLKTLLEGLGHLVEISSDSDEALTILQRKRFDIIITDLKMPKRSGLEILDAAKQKDRNVRVFIITGLGTAACIAEALRKGADGCISKPFVLKDIQTAMYSI